MVRIALSVAFARDPVLDVLGAVEELDSALLAAAEEPHGADVHQRHLREIQSLAGCRGVDLRLDFRETLRLESTNQANDCPSLGGNPLDAQSHWLTVADATALHVFGKGKRRATAN